MQTFSRHGHRFHVHIPQGASAGPPMPLVVMLHGCEQDVEALAAATGMNRLADRAGFAVLYPEQSKASNPRGCWNWYFPEHQGRDTGEAALIHGMITHVQSQFAIDEGSIFVAGMSAGACMATILAANYPETIAAIALHSGLCFKAAHDARTGLRAMGRGGPEPVQQGRAAFEAMGSNARLMPVIAFQGSKDTLVNPLNAESVIVQWATTNDLIAQAVGGRVTTDASEVVEARVPEGYSFRRSRYDGPDGRTLLELYVVEDLAHAWSGGPSGDPFSDPKGPDATSVIWEFFTAHRRTDH